MNIRQTNWDIAKNKCFDITIIGGGVSGASIYRKLCQQGYKVFLVDKGDFSCGTSQASSMMAWGGLLYLIRGQLSSAYNFSKDRDTLIESFSDQVTPQDFKIISNSELGWAKYLIHPALQVYWALGIFKRKRPTYQKNIEELSFLTNQNVQGAFTYQEGFLKYSDSRFVLNWIINHQSKDSFALNYCSIQNVKYNNKDKLWSLNLSDFFSKKECAIKSKLILNCAGVWTDEVNEQFKIQSSYKHIYGKGVFIGYERPQNHNCPLVIKMTDGNFSTFIPWGPISLWGPTETAENSIEGGFSINPEDLNYLSRHASQSLNSSFTKSRIVSFRCGLRPLAVKKKTFVEKKAVNASKIIRQYIIDESSELPWISIYGGKITGSISMAEKVAKKISDRISPKLKTFSSLDYNHQNISYTHFPGLDEGVPTIDQCVSHEFCCTLEDYLRRRTNISQWVPRMGLGFQNENVKFLRELSSCLPEFKNTDYDNHLQEYQDSVHQYFDKLVTQLNNIR